MYTTGIEAILGFQLSGNILTIDPHINPEWKSYKIIYRYKSSVYEILVRNPNRLAFATTKNVIELHDDGAHHNVVVELN